MEGNLNGMCARASAKMWRELEAVGVKSELHVWICPEDQQSAHVYIVADDHVVDVTCTQFTKLRNTPILIEHVREAERWDWYQGQLVFATPADLVKWQKKTKWPPDQTAWSK
jgi:hypothetical protein